MTPGGRRRRCRLCTKGSQKEASARSSPGMRTSWQTSSPIPACWACTTTRSFPRIALWSRPCMHEERASWRRSSTGVRRRGSIPPARAFSGRPPSRSRARALSLRKPRSKTSTTWFDVVEVHAAHGYLLSQFLSSRMNQRTDAYGGSIENRARIVVEVIEAARREVGLAFPLMIKLNSSDGAGGGLTEDDSRRGERGLASLQDARVCGGAILRRLRTAFGARGGRAGGGDGREQELRSNGAHGGRRRDCRVRFEPSAALRARSCRSVEGGSCVFGALRILHPMRRVSRSPLHPEKARRSGGVPSRSG